MSCVSAESLAVTLGVSLEEAKNIVQDSLAAELAASRKSPDQCNAKQISEELGISQAEAKQILEQNSDENCNEDVLSEALGITKEEAKQVLEQNLKRLAAHSMQNGRTEELQAILASEENLVRCDSDELSSAFGISKEEARLLIEQNITRFTSPDRKLPRLEEMALEMGLSEEEVKKLVEEGGQAADRRGSCDEDADLAFAVSVQEQIEADARRNDRVQVQRDAELSEEMSEPEYQCLACLEVFKVSRLYTVDCPASHRFCFDDIRRLVDSCLQRRELATCPLCRDPPHQISEAEVRQLFGRGAQLDALYDATLRSALAAADDVVACPTPDCPQYLVLSSRCTRLMRVGSKG